MSRSMAEGGGVDPLTSRSPLVFETSCRPTQRHLPNGGRAVDRTRAALLVAGYGLASRRITALPPFRSEDVDRLLDDMSVLLCVAAYSLRWLSRPKPRCD